LRQEETLGELEMGIYFGKGLERADARSAAAGWGWDRLRVYRGRGGAAGVVWYSNWDDEREAREAEEAAQKAQLTVESSRRRPHSVTRRGRNVLVILRMPSSLHEGLIDAYLSESR
jgi:hypothetical protein